MTVRFANLLRTWIARLLAVAAVFWGALATLRAASTDASLAAWESRIGYFIPLTLTPSFAPSVTNYSATVPNRDEALTVRATTATPLASMQWRFNGGAPQPLLSNAYSLFSPLSVGTNLVQVEVTAEDAVTKKSYFLTVVRAAAPPQAVTMDAAPADGAVVALNATAFPKGTATTVWFEWGLAGTPLTNTTPATVVGPLNGPALVNSVVSNVAPNVEYAFTVAASNAAGFLRGEPRRFVRAFAEVPTPFPLLHQATAAWGDYDNDGRLDLLLAGRSTNGPLTQLWRNTGAGFVDSGFAFPGVFHGAAAWGDYDNDGRLDLALSGFGSYDTNFAPVLRAAIFRNTGSGFTNIGAALPGVSHGSLAWGDYDRDGRLDLLLCGEARFVSAGFIPLTQLWRNTTNGFVESGLGLTGVRHGAAAWGDYDNDGRPDVLLAGRASSGPVAQVWRNTGAGFALANISLPGVEQATAAWGDFDSDGKLDLQLSGLSTNNQPIVQVWRNTGAGFTNTGTALPGLRGGGAAWGDTDNDGRADLWLAGSAAGYPRFTGTTLLWRQGAGAGSNSTAVLPRVGAGAVALADYDTDGRLDALLAAPRAGTLFAEPTNTTYVAIRADGLDGAGTQDDPRHGATAAVVHEVLEGINGQKVVFGPGVFPLTNFVFFEDNCVVEGAGWGRTVFEVGTNVTAGFEFTTFYPTSENATNNIFRGFTVDVRAHLNTVFTNSMNGLTILGSGNVVEIEVLNPKGNWLSGRECFPIRTWPPHLHFNAPNAGGNVIRSRVVATNIDYPYDYITAITAGGRRTNAPGAEYDLMEHCTVIGRSRTNINGAYGVAGRAILRHSYARSLGNAVYHETQSGGSQDGNNGEDVVHANRFEDVTRGVLIRGFLTNTDFQISHNHITASLAGVFAMYEDGGAFSNVLIVANTIRSTGGAGLPEGGLAINRLRGALIAQNVVGDDITHNPVTFSTGVTFIGNRAIGGAPIIADTPPALRTNLSDFEVKGVSLGTGFDGALSPAALWRGLAPATNTPPAAPTGLVTQVLSNQVAFKWSAASDAQTAAPALTYHVRAGTAPGQDDLLAAQAAADGRRRAAQPGNTGAVLSLAFAPPPGVPVHWSVQAVDAAFAGSLFAAEQSFVYAPPAGSALAGDLDGNGIVTEGELGQVAANYWSNVPPEFASVPAPAGTDFQFTLTNLASLNLLAQVSTNLSDWQALGPAALRYQINDPDATNHNQRFYRLVLP
jgi:hypothetical protein